MSNKPNKSLQRTRRKHRAADLSRSHGKSIPDYTATEALELLLNDFLESRKSFSPICDYDETMTQMREKYNRLFEQIDVLLNP
jgi:hypothetical protein